MWLSEDGPLCIETFKQYKPLLLRLMSVLLRRIDHEGWQ